MPHYYSSLADEKLSNFARTRDIPLEYAEGNHFVQVTDRRYKYRRCCFLQKLDGRKWLQDFGENEHKKAGKTIGISKA